jgi:hypothetical protein
MSRIQTSKTKKVALQIFSVSSDIYKVSFLLWLLDLQLPMQSVPITTDVVSSNLDQGKVYNIMW